MMDGETETCRVSFQNEIKFVILCVWLVLLLNYITMHGPTDVKNAISEI